ncbi:MAG TPA: cysteine desulfurase [Clostridia bacterium]|nr:cysteine desulfurase [Clostridia bacterium]
MTDYKRDFPLLLQKDGEGRSLAYLDNAATTQKPKQVIEAVRTYYETFNANPHRGAYAISEKVTEAFEKVRGKAARFIGAKDTEEIVFTFGATDAINLAAMSYGEQNVTKGDEILLSVTEHHSNLLPWQRLSKRTGAELRYLFPDETGRVSLEEFRKKLTANTKVVAITHVSNVLGGINPIREMAAMAHEKGAVVLMDAAQSAPHIPLDAQALDVDFLAFSGHKMLGPAGIGVLYGKKELLKSMEPVRLGGGIVEEVTQQTVRFLDAPWKFEAGTQNAEGVIGLGAAIDYLNAVGMQNIREIEGRLTEYALEKLSKVPKIELYGAGSGRDRTGILSFNMEGVHPHDTATILANDGIAVRAGHHCAQPLMTYLGVNATCRMSLYFYNTEEDIDRLVRSLETVRGVLGFESE